MVFILLCLYFKPKTLSTAYHCTPHFALYKTLSQEFFQIISTFSKKLEVASIDECYVDMTEYIQEHHLQPYQVAQNIQKRFIIH